MAKSLASKSKADAQPAASTAVVESNPGSGGAADMFRRRADVVESKPVEPLFQRSPYVQFVSTKGQAFMKCVPFIPDLAEGDPVLIRPEPASPRKLNPMRFWLAQWFQHFSHVDTDGYIVRSVFDVEEAKRDPATGTEKLVEHVETVLLVIEPNGDITPARCTFKSTKVNAAHAAISAIHAAGSAEWPNLSPDHRATLAIPDAPLRVVTAVSLKSGTGRGSGFKYVAANGMPKPTTVGEAQALQARFADPAFNRLCNAVLKSWEERCDEIRNAAE